MKIAHACCCFATCPLSKFMVTRQNGCPMAIKLNSIPFLGPKMCMLAAEFLFFCSIPTALSGKALDGILPAQKFHIVLGMLIHSNIPFAIANCRNVRGLGRV